LKRAGIFFMIIMLFVTVVLSACQSDNNELIPDDELYKRKLTIELVVENTDNRLFEKIRQFDEERRYVEVEIRKVSPAKELNPWLLDKKGAGDPPDLIELIPNQMRMAFHHGKLETLNLHRPQLQNLVITSPDGDVIGVKTKINPLLVYYNKDDFLQLGLDVPSEDWDWTTLDNTITALKTAGKNVYIIFAPSLLEWVTMNRFGGRIVDPGGMTFTGYLNSEEAVHAAEWLMWVDTREGDYRARDSYEGRVINGKRYYPMPYDLIEGNMALAIDFAVQYRANFEEIIQRNGQIGIANLPGGSHMVNVANTSGLVIPKFSENKDLAVELLQYLTKDAETYYEDILRYTLHARSSVELHDTDRVSVLVKEFKAVGSCIFVHA